jgi:hypothetical protein
MIRFDSAVSIVQTICGIKGIAGDIFGDIRSQQICEEVTSSEGVARYPVIVIHGIELCGDPHLSEIVVAFR